MLTDFFMRQTTRLVLIVVWTSIFLSACFSNHSEIPPSKPTIESISGMTYSEIVAREKEKDRQNVILPVNTIVPTHETLAPEKQTEHPAPGIIDMISDDSLTKFISPIVAFTKGDYVPTNLITITNSNSLGTSSETMLRKEALDSLVKLADAFHKQFGKKILVVSGYRSYEYQL